MSLPQIFTDIANSIRVKNGLETLYKPAQMANAILDIPTAENFGLELGPNLLTELVDTANVVPFESRSIDSHAGNEYFLCWRAQSSVRDTNIDTVSLDASESPFNTSVYKNQIEPLAAIAEVGTSTQTIANDMCIGFAQTDIDVEPDSYYLFEGYIARANYNNSSYANAVVEVGICGVNNNGIPATGRIIAPEAGKLRLAQMPQIKFQAENTQRQLLAESYVYCPIICYSGKGFISGTDNQIYAFMIGLNYLQGYGAYMGFCLPSLRKIILPNE